MAGWTQDELVHAIMVVTSGQPPPSGRARTISTRPRWHMAPVTAAGKVEGGRGRGAGSSAAALVC
eukprot:6212707-Pleurochrysis_carterae.AAC.4